MPLQGVEFQAILFLIVCRNAVPDPDLEIGGGGGSPGFAMGNVRVFEYNRILYSLEFKQW